MKPKINAFWGILAALLILGSLALCYYGAREGVVYVESRQQPREVVVRFFNAMTAQDYDTAYACLGNVSSLGLENEVRDPDAARILESLRYSFSCSMDGDCVARGGKAVQPVRLRVLDLDAVEAAIKETRTDEEGRELNDTEKLDAILAEPLNYSSTGSYEVVLRYGEDGWKIWLEQPLLNALMGRPNQEVAE